MIVCDISDPHFEKHLEVTKSVLKELGVDDKDQMIVFNKKDLFHDEIKKKIILRKYSNSFLISTNDSEDIKNLRKNIVDFFLRKQLPFDLFVPYEDGATHATIRSKTNIINTSHHEKGIFYRIRVPDFMFGSLGLQKFILAPDSEVLNELIWT